MTQPVNLENLHEMTGGDKDLEKELFDVYLSSSEKCLAELRMSTAPGAEEVWRSQAHAWKGMSLNLGAETLGKLCAEGQLSPNMAEDEKVKLLARIVEEYEKVKAFLKTA